MRQRRGSSETWREFAPNGPRHIRLDKAVVGGSGCSGTANSDQHGVRKPMARAAAPPHASQRQGLRPRA